MELLYFYLPVILTVILFLLPIDKEKWILSIPFIYIGLQMIDSGHIWPSFVVAFSVDKYKWILRTIPVILLIFYVIIGYFYGKFGIYRAHAHLAAIHFIRQQYGLYKLSCNINPSPKDIFQRIEIYSLYVITLTSLTARMSIGSRWMREGDLFKIPSVYFTPSLVLFVLAVAIGILSFLYQKKAFGVFSKSRFIIFTSGAVAWGAIGFSGYPLIALFPLFHDLPYLGLVYSYPIESFEKFKTFFRKYTRFHYILGFSVFLFFTIYFGSKFEGYLFRNFDYAVDPKTGDFLMVLLCTLAFLPTTTHYLVDAVIWRRDVLPKTILDNVGK